LEIKRDILWRVYICFMIMLLLCAIVLAKAFYIQDVQGSYWRNLRDSLHQKIEELEAERGTIYSEDGEMLSTSIPRFNIYIDFAADGLRNNNGKLFWKNLDSLSICLAALFEDKSADAYKKFLKQGYNKRERYFLLKSKISFQQYKQLREFPLVRLGKNNSGFIAEVKNIRLNPYQQLAYRTIGLDRENAQKVGLEKTYDSVLKGTSGKRLVQYIGSGMRMPVEDGIQIEPENGKDIITTLDTRIQEITETALMKMMIANEAVSGCAIVMEVTTGKIKAIANLGQQPDGSYQEDFNYALMPSEPGSTFKLASLLCLLEDKKISLNTLVNLEKGSWKINGRTVFDSEQHGLEEVTAKKAFEASSNVGMAKLVYFHYASAPSAFIRHLQKLHLDTTTGIDLTGERKSVIYKPGSKYWSSVTLPWMAFGYNIAVTPMHTAMLYNAVANKGIMLKPYLVNAIQSDSKTTTTFSPVVLNKAICSPQTISLLHEALKGVCHETGGTGYSLFKNTPYEVAGKTGTSLVADNKLGYSNHIYQSSFAGFFPANNPQYTCVVVIKNKPQAKKYYGAAVAGPVFKEIADKLYMLFIKNKQTIDTIYLQPKDSVFEHFTTQGFRNNIQPIATQLSLSSPLPKAAQADWIELKKNNAATQVNTLNIQTNYMPSLIHMNMKDALYLCEKLGLQVTVEGRGRINEQSIPANTIIYPNQKIKLTLNK